MTGLLALHASSTAMPKGSLRLCTQTISEICIEVHERFSTERVLDLKP